MVVGHQHLQTERLGLRHTLHTGNAVVYRDEHIGTAVFHTMCDGWCQSIAIDHAVRHDVAHMLRAQQTQPTHSDCTCGSTVAVIVSHHAQVFVLCHRIS
jgi:hypothetical protein